MTEAAGALPVTSDLVCAATPTAAIRPRRTAPTALVDLADVSGARLQPADGPVATPVTGITLRAQSVRPGDLFAALPGARVHGISFAADAAAAGAVAVLTDPAGAVAATADPAVGLPLLICTDPRAVLGEVSAAVYGRPSEHTRVIGVTGTSGKTTTCYLLEAALAAAGCRPGLVGTVQIRIDGQVAPSSLTTPEAPDLQAMLAAMVEAGSRAVAMEVSSHALSLGRVAGTRFAAGGFTNLSQDHLDFHPDMESYFQAKALLFDGRAAAGVIDVDDAYGARLAALHPECRTVSATARPDTDWSVLASGPGRLGHQVFVARGPSGPPLEVELALPGAFNVANAVLALALVDAAGLDVPLAQAAGALADVVVPGRMEPVQAGQDFLVLVDYAHKPAALEAVLRAVSTGLTGRLIVVVGAGGDRDRGKRAQMGAAAAQAADLVVVTDDNPRSEAAASIRAAVLAGARENTGRTRPGRAELREIGDRREAIRAAVAAARPGDVVVVAGKGHEHGQEIAGVVHPFSDRAEVLSALAKSGHEVTR